MHAGVLVVTAGTFRILLWFATAEHAGTSSSVIFGVYCSSRGRHTIFDCDWSSDVCSSDLRWPNILGLLDRSAWESNSPFSSASAAHVDVDRRARCEPLDLRDEHVRARRERPRRRSIRSEERRVGKEGRSRWSPYH